LAVLSAVEGVLLALLAIAYAAAGVVGKPSSLTGTEVAAAFAFAAGLLMLWFARHLSRAQRWARTPVFLVNLLAVPVGIGLYQGHQWLAGSVVLALALLTLGHVFAPSVSASLQE
jgi:hypothetical protein